MDKLPIFILTIALPAETKKKARKEIWLRVPNGKVLDCKKDNGKR